MKYNVTTLAVHTSKSGKFFVQAQTAAEDQAFAAIGIPGKLITVSAYAEFANLEAATKALPLMEQQKAKLQIEVEVGQNLGNLVIV